MKERPLSNTALAASDVQPAALSASGELPHKPSARAGLTGAPFTVAKRIRPEAVRDLEALLLKLGDDIEGDKKLQLPKLSLVHFLRFVIVPRPQDSGPHWLVFGSDHDGTLDEHLNELWTHSGTGLKEIYAHCEGGALASAADLKKYFKQETLAYAATYSGTRDRSAQQVRQEDALQTMLANYLDTPQGRAACAQDPQQAVAAFVKDLAQAPLDLAEPVVDTTSLLSKIAHGPGFYALIALAAAALGVPALVFYGLVRLKEATETVDPSAHTEANKDLLEQLKGKEDHRKLVQNQLTHLVPIKPGLFRMFTLKLVLGGINVLARHYFDQGNLGGIPSIHYARWMILKETRQLLFFSNFDGSWESYLGDFVDQAASGLTGVWSNTLGFPKAKGLLGDGARDEESFKNWTRRHQIETQIWFSAYPNLSVQNINDNTQLRRGVARRPTTREAMALWLRTL